MTRKRIGLMIALVTFAVAAAYGSPPQASTQSGMNDGMQNGSMGTMQKQSTHELKITLRTEPEIAKGAQENTFHVSVADADGKPVSDATVTLALVMPAMPQMNMAEMRVSPAVAWNGSDYAGKAKIPSVGMWNVTVKVLRQNKEVVSKKMELVAK
jgi:hypothetical protein